jgi:hypothetical protein
MLTVSLKINPKCSKRKIDEVDISSGQTYLKSRDDLYLYATQLGDCSITENKDHSFHLVVRSLNKSNYSNEFIRRFFNEDDKKVEEKKIEEKKVIKEKKENKENKEILFCRKDHEEKFLFRGKLIKQTSATTSFTNCVLENLEKNKKIKIKNSTSCRICMDKTSNCTFYPCGHVCLCDDCKQDYEKQYSICPLCKQNYTVCFRIYF